MTISIENNTYSILNLEIESIEEESLAYYNATGMIILFNDTATKIWEYILESSNLQKPIRVSDICDMIMIKYNIQSDQYDAIYMDISNILSDFVNYGLLVGKKPIELDVTDCEETI